VGSPGEHSWKQCSFVDGPFVETKELIAGHKIPDRHPGSRRDDEYPRRPRRRPRCRATGKSSSLAQDPRFQAGTGAVRRWQSVSLGQPPSGAFPHLAWRLRHSRPATECDQVGWTMRFRSASGATRWAQVIDTPERCCGPPRTCRLGSRLARAGVPAGSPAGRAVSPADRR
jgi:hypothetical protein